MKVGNWHICPNCGCKGIFIGGGDYKHTGEGFGHQVRMMNYQCEKCKQVWSE